MINDKDKESFDKFVQKMKSKGITIEDDTEISSWDGTPLNNKIISNGKETIKMSHHSIYRRSGMCRAMKKKKGGGDQDYEFVKFTYQMWLTGFIEPIILNGLKMVDKKS